MWSITQTYPIEKVLTLEIEARSGTVTVTGRDVQQVTLQMLVHGQDGDGAELLAAVQQQGDRLTIRAPDTGARLWDSFAQGVRIDYVLSVPRRATCRITTRSGRVNVSGIEGPLAIDSASGSVSVREIGGAVSVVARSGAVDAHSIAGGLLLDAHSGRVTVRGVGGETRIVARSGAVKVEQAAALILQGRSGTLEARDCAGPVDIEARSGDVTLLNMAGALRLRGNSGSVALRGAIQHDVEIETGSGGICLEVDPAFPFYIDAQTASGSIHSDLSPWDHAPVASERGPSVRLRARRGSIRILRTAGQQAGNVRATAVGIQERLD